MRVWSHSENYFSPSNQALGICGVQPHYIKYFSKPHLKTWSRLKQINCEILHVYIISAHQRITKVVLHNLPSVYTVSKLGYTEKCFVFCWVFFIFIACLESGFNSGSTHQSVEPYMRNRSQVSKLFCVILKCSNEVILIQCKVQYTHTGEAIFTWNKHQTPAAIRGIQAIPAAQFTTSYSTYAFALFPPFGGNSSHDSSAECQRVGKAMFFSSWAEGAFGVQISHVTRCCDSFPARWH